MATNRKGDVELVVSAKNEATQTINELVRSLDQLGKEAGQSGIGGLFKKLAQSSADLSKRQGELTDALDRTRKAQDQLQKANDEREKDLQEQRDAIDKTEKSLEKLNSSYREYADNARKARSPSDSLVQTFEKQQKRQASLAESIDETSRELSEAQSRLEQNQGVDQQATTNIEKYRQRVIDLGESWRETTRAVADAQRVLSERTRVRDSADSGQKDAQARLDVLREELQVARQFEKEQRRIAREAGEATDEQVKAKEEAIAATKRLKEEVEQQVLVERKARNERDATAKSYREQSREVTKLVSQADKQKAAYVDLKAGLEDYRKAQEKDSTERQRQNIQKLNASLEKLQDQYKAAATRVENTQDRLNKAAGPDPRAIAKFENLKQKIKETEEEIREQTSVLEGMKREYVEAGASADQLAQKERELESVTERVTQEQKELATQTDKTAAATDRAGKEAAQAGTRFRVWGEDSRQALSFLQRIRGELLAIAAAYTGVFAVGGAVRSIYNASVLTTKATARLSAKFNGDFKAIEQEIKFVREEADRLGIEFETLLEQYTKFVNNVPDGVLTIDQIRFTFSGIAEASRAAGLGTQDITAVFTALGQIAAKGALQLEELRQQLGERIPAAIENTAKGLTEMTGELVTTEDLLARINKGEVSSTAIVALAQSLKKEFGPSLDTALDSPLAALARFKNTLFDIRMEIAKSGFIDELTNGLQALNKQMKTPEFREGMRSFANALSGAVQFGVLLVKNIDTIIAALKALIALKAAGYIQSLGAQIVIMGRAAMTAGAQVATATTLLGKMRAAVLALYRAALLLPAAFYAGFTIGEMLERQFPALRKVALTFIGVFEKMGITINEKVDLMTTYFKRGWLNVIRDVLIFFTDLIPTALEKMLNHLADKFEVFSSGMAANLRKAAAAIGDSNDNVINSIFDQLTEESPDMGDTFAAIKANAEEARQSVDANITEMFRLIDEQNREAKSKAGEAGEESGERYGKEFMQGLRDLDYFQTGVNAGKSLGQGLISQLKNIRQALEEESASTLEDRLKLIEAEFGEFLKNVGSFQAEGDQNIVEIQEKAQERINKLRENSNIDQEIKVREIAAIEKRAAQEIAGIRENQSLLADAPQLVNRLVELRKEKERQKQIEADIEASQKRINDLVRERQTEIDRVNELAELGLISTEQQGNRISAINDEMIVKLEQAVEAARQLAEETGNADMQKFVDQFSNFDELERRRAALESLNRLEQQINDQYNLRQTKLDTLNTLRETGAIDAATAEQKAKTILDQSNNTLGQMIDKAIILAQKLGDEGLVANLKNMKAGLVELNDQVFNGANLSQSFASGFTGAFDAFIQGTKSAGEAFRSFVADFLRQIANAIIQALILKAITGSFSGGTGGAGGAVASGLNAMFNHTGGVVGQDGSSKLVNPSVFFNAVKYHSGGVAGLKPNEVPTILEKGEEVLTANDPRHRNNQGSEGQPGGVKIINAIDSSSVVTEGLNTSQGQKAIVNMIRANKAQIKSVLA